MTPINVPSGENRSSSCFEKWSTTSAPVVSRARSHARLSSRLSGCCRSPMRVSGIESICQAVSLVHADVALCTIRIPALSVTTARLRSLRSSPAQPTSTSAAHRCGVATLMWPHLAVVLIEDLDSASARSTTPAGNRRNVTGPERTRNWRCLSASPLPSRSTALMFPTFSGARFPSSHRSRLIRASRRTHGVCLYSHAVVGCHYRACYRGAKCLRSIASVYRPSRVHGEIVGNER